MIFVSSRKLYRLIFQSGKPAEGRILISPDGQYFPFEALVTSDAGQPMKYFLNDYAVSYTYSAKYLVNPFVKTKSGAGFFGRRSGNLSALYAAGIF